jgi:phosphoglycolate phosphatase
MVGQPPAEAGLSDAIGDGPGPALKLVLFDIDGTILLTGGAGRVTMDRIYEDLFGVTSAFDGLHADGKTDPLIFAELLQRHAIEVDDEAAVLAEIRRRYEAGFAEAMGRSPASLMPGVVQVIEALHARNDVQLALLTGNLERTARIKVDHFDLGGYFPFGAYASDSAHRRDLPPVAVRRAEEHLGRAVGLGPHVIIIGDTPKDVDCALANGCTAVGVGAARYSVDDLRRAGAHHVLPDLCDADAVVEIISRA